MFNVYEMVKQRILEGLEKINKGLATEKWVKPWSLNKVRPMNWQSSRVYSGVNLWLLDGAGTEFLTFNQIKEQPNAKLKKGAKGRPVVFFKWIDEETDEKTGEVLTKAHPVVRYYNVFSLDDIDGLELKRKVETFEHKPEDAEEKLNDALFDYFRREGIEARFTKSAKAYYSPNADSISCPENRYFKQYNRFLGTLSHEAAHSTASRLGRDMGGVKGDEKYGYEELVAEFASSLLLSHFGVDDVITADNNVAYINSWMKAIKDMPSKKLVQAMQAAQKAANYILNITE